LVFLAASESAGQCLASMAAGPGAGVSTTPFGAGCFQAERLAGEGAWSWGVGSGEEEEEAEAEAGGSMAARRGGLGFRGGGGLRRRRRRRW
jgi:hypothetical protein